MNQLTRRPGSHLDRFLEDYPKPSWLQKVLLKPVFKRFVDPLEVRSTRLALRLHEILKQLDDLEASTRTESLREIEYDLESVNDEAIEFSRANFGGLIKECVFEYLQGHNDRDAFKKSYDDLIEEFEGHFKRSLDVGAKEALSKRLEQLKLRRQALEEPNLSPTKLRAPVEMLIAHELLYYHLCDFGTRRIRGLRNKTDCNESQFAKERELLLSTRKMLGGELSEEEKRLLERKVDWDEVTQAYKETVSVYGQIYLDNLALHDGNLDSVPKALIAGRSIALAKAIVGEDFFNEMIAKGTELALEHGRACGVKRHRIAGNMSISINPPGQDYEADWSYKCDYNSYRLSWAKFLHVFEHWNDNSEE